MNLKVIFIIAVILSAIALAVSTYANTVTGGFTPTGGPTGVSYDNGNFYGYAFQLPTTVINDNPYGGNTGNYTLINAIAIKYGVVTAVVWFYQPPNGQGGLLSDQNSPMPSTPYDNTPWLYVGTNNSLLGGDWLYYYPPPEVITNALPVGWHMAVIEEYASSGHFYLTLYLDGKYVGTADLFYPSSSILPQLFGSTPNFPANGIDTYPFGFIGVAYADWPAGNGRYFFYNGTIAIVAFYNVLLPDSVINQMWKNSQVMSNGISIYLPMQDLMVAYVFSPSFFNVNTGALTPYYVNNTALHELGIANPDLMLVTSGANLQSNMWAGYSITVNTSGKPSAATTQNWSLITMMIVVIIAIVTITVVFLRRRK
ncbi:hypothetical protein [Vulcanisaeta sp. JCM 16159]|uniref:hypothetical protein n=1 Tax=Vulcanisaeta sp. JCM 16159 TaxID=1295371 RepID=UPI0006D02C05|nr:hypothetical protein [Vulcanisaeta sp. JCM 16159]